MITGHDIIGWAPVIVVASADCAAKSTPKNTGILTPTRNMNRKETAVATLCSIFVSICLCLITIPKTKAGNNTSIWMLASSP